MGQKADQVLADLKESRSKTQGAITEATKLKEKRAFTIEKRKICEKFLRMFRLTGEELDTIRSADAPIDSNFFAALNKIHAIRRNCKLMAKVESSNLNGNTSRAAATAGDLGGGASDKLSGDHSMMILNQNSAIDAM